MQKTNILLAVTAGLLTLGLVAPAHAETPPSWALGTFAGKDWKGRPMTLTFDDSGSVRRYIWVQKHTVHDTGFYKGDGKFTLGGKTWQVDDTSKGIKVDIKNDDRGWLTLDRKKSEVPSTNPPRPEDEDDKYAPSWALGRFVGRSQVGDHTVGVNINRTTVTIRYKTKDPWTETGRWRDGYFLVGRKQYRVVQNGRGVILVNRRDKNDYFQVIPA